MLGGRIAVGGRCIKVCIINVHVKAHMAEETRPRLSGSQLARNTVEHLVSHHQRKRNNLTLILAVAKYGVVNL